MIVDTKPILETEEYGYGAGDEEAGVPAPVPQVLLQRLGVSALPAHETLHIAADQLLVPEATHSLRAAKRLVKSIQQVGILQSPSVVFLNGQDMHDPDANFEVIAGRRRVLAARLAGLPVIKCEVYASSSLPLSSLLALIENTQRSAAWVQEVGALRQLMDEKVGLTMDDLAHFGFDRLHLAERLKIAQLPAPLLSQVMAGTMSRDVARKLVRLTSSQQERIAQLAEGGEEVTADLVKEALRVQIAGGLHPLQDTLTPFVFPMEVPGTSIPSRVVSSPDLLPLGFAGDEPLHACPDMTTEQTVSKKPRREGQGLHEMFQALLLFQRSDDYREVSPSLRTLTEAYIQQIQLVFRTLPARTKKDPCDSLS